MNRILLLIFLFSNFIIRVFCENPSDYLVFPEETYFNSSVEEKIFNQVYHKSSNYFSLLLSADSNITEEEIKTYENKINHFVEDVRKTKVLAKPPKKQIQIIYKKVHEHFLKVYKLENMTTDIFKDGSYNCVSATALYVEIFRQLGIPYSIIELPTHVYVIAYPNTLSIEIETTTPNNGYNMYTDREIQQFITQLTNNKIISVEERNSTSDLELFKKYLYAESIIDYKKLVGLQYWNLAVYEAEKENFSTAYNHLRKAYLFHPNDRNAYYMVYLAGRILDKDSYKKVSNIDYVAQLSRYKKYGIENELVKSEFSKILNSYLIYDYNPEKLDSLFSRLIAGNLDSTLEKDISTMYYHERSRNLFSVGEYKSSMNFAEKGCLLFEDNQPLHSLLILSLLSYLDGMTNYEAVDSTLEYYQQKLPNISTNKRFINALLSNKLLLMSHHFEMGKATLGKEYQAEFEQLFELHKEEKINQALISQAYSNASIYYFKINNDYKAKALLKKGLEYIPNDHQLNFRLRSF